jgi:uncharacterized membrane protein YkoI
MTRGFLACLLTLLLQGTAAAWVIEPPAVLPDTDWTVQFAAQSGISLAEATQMAVARFPGQVVRAETIMRGNRMIHRIRVLADDGRVRTVQIDAQTGAFL